MSEAKNHNAKGADTVAKTCEVCPYEGEGGVV
jgi:hypothetical protein